MVKKVIIKMNNKYLQEFSLGKHKNRGRGWKLQTKFLRGFVCLWMLYHVWSCYLNDIDIKQVHIIQ